MSRITSTVHAGRAFVAWLVVLAVGFLYLIRYEMTPGRSESAPPPKFPTGCGVATSDDRPTLVMFVHPRCPCTRASVEQLARVFAQQGTPVNRCVVFLQPSTMPETWTQTDLWRSVGRIPEVQLLIDQDGEVASAFGVGTSGHVLFYDAAGVLRFQGGITASRGHHGGNYGHAALVSLMNGHVPERKSTPVFGCALTRNSASISRDCSRCPTP